MNKPQQSIFRSVICSLFLFQLLSLANAQIPGPRFEMSGTLSLTNYSRDGKILTNHQGTFHLIRYDQAWSITTKYLSLNSVEECVFDGQALYCLHRNSTVLTNFDGQNLPPPPGPSHIEDGILHTDVVGASIFDSAQPEGATSFLRTVWLGAVAGDLGTDRWKKPVILPWSVGLPGGVQYFGAHPEQDAPPLDNMEFKVIKESRESRVGSNVMRFPEMQSFLPLGMKVGRLEALTWTNVGTMPVPASWLVTRLSPGSSEVIQERYLAQGKIVNLDPSPIKAPALGAITSVTDLRIKLNDVTIPIDYTLTNQPWPSKDDPHLMELAKQKASAYLEDVRNFSKSMPGSANAGVNNIIQGAMGLVLGEILDVENADFVLNADTELVYYVYASDPRQRFRKSQGCNVYITPISKRISSIRLPMDFSTEAEAEAEKEAIIAIFKKQFGEPLKPDSTINLTNITIFATGPRTIELKCNHLKGHLSLTFRDRDMVALGNKEAAELRNTGTKSQPPEK